MLMRFKFFCFAGISRGDWIAQASCWMEEKERWIQSYHVCFWWVQDHCSQSLPTEKRFLSVVANPVNLVSVIGNLVAAQVATEIGWSEFAISMFSLGMVHYLQARTVQENYKKVKHYMVDLLIPFNIPWSSLCWICSWSENKHGLWFNAADMYCVCFGFCFSHAN